MKRYKCPCGYIYDPDQGEPQNRIEPGTAFENLPETWICPWCGYEKEYFTEMKDDAV